MVNLCTNLLYEYLGAASIPLCLPLTPYNPSQNTNRVSDLSQQDDPLLCAPVGGDIEHAGAVAPDDPVLHFRILAYVVVHGPDHSQSRTNIGGLRNPELIDGCGGTKTSE